MFTRIGRGVGIGVCFAGALALSGCDAASIWADVSTATSIVQGIVSASCHYLPLATDVANEISANSKKLPTYEALAQMICGAAAGQTSLTGAAAPAGGMTVKLPDGMPIHLTPVPVAK